MKIKLRHLQTIKPYGIRLQFYTNRQLNLTLSEISLILIFTTGRYCTY